MARFDNNGKFDRDAARRPIEISWEALDSDAPLRKTGIDLIGPVPWGTHLCLLYETKQDLLDTNTAYLRAGLENNELCVWATSEPIGHDEARSALQHGIPDFEHHYAAGGLNIVSGTDWYLPGGQFELKRIVESGREMRGGAYDGLRISGNAQWQQSSSWMDFCEYERALDLSVAGSRMLLLCTYALGAGRVTDILDVAHAHQCTIAIRNGDWEFLEVPGLRQARKEIRILTDDLDILSKPFPGRDLLTPRERAVLVQIAKGASSKEAARTLGISPRTVEFHRANVLQKLSAKNTAELIRLVLR